MRVVDWKLPMTAVILLATMASSASAQTILIYDENSTNMRAIDAATRLGLTFTRARAADFDTLLRGSRWDLVIVDMPSTEPSGMWQAAIVDHIAAGGRAIHTQWQSTTLGGLGPAYQVTIGMGHNALPFYRWSSDSLFTTPQVVPDGFTMLMDLWGTNGFYLEPMMGARAAAGFTMTPAANQAAIVIGNSGRTIFNGFLFDDYAAFDADADGIPDITELVMNEISLLAAIFPTAPCVGLAEGAACTATPGGAGVCRGGVCCYGCWNGMRCERGTAPSACATGGAMCASCLDGVECTLDLCEGGTCRNPMAPAGTACTDGMFCTATDACNSLGACTGTGTPCRDGDTCTEDVCAEATDSCSFPPVATSCTIGGTCVGGGMINPTNPCQVCDPARRMDDWSPVEVGTTCGASTCTAGRVRTRTCDATATCVTSAPAMCPTGMCLDAMSCEPGCMPGTCPAGEYCDLASMRCMPQVMTGEDCDDAAACPTGFCVDGVCCESACDGVCERCDTLGTVGSCIPLSAGADPDMECDTTCDGAGACMGDRDAGVDAGRADDGGTRSDAGRRDAGAGPPIVRRDDGCTCSAASGDLPIALTTLVLFMLRRRRRRVTRG